MYSFNAKTPVWSFERNNGELFWLKLNRLLKLLKLRAVLIVIVAVVAGGSYLERAEIAEVWKSLRDSVEDYFDQEITP